MIRKLLIGFALGVASFAHSAGILVVQTTIGSHADDADGNRMLGQLMAEELDNDGRIIPIAWSLSDPLFRRAVDEKLVKASNNPGIDEILNSAEKLKTDYVFVCAVFRKNNDVLGRASLYHKGKLVWSDPEPSTNQADRSAFDKDSRVVTVGLNGKIDLSNTLRGAAHTWSQLLFTTPLKGLTPRPRVETPPPDPGTKPNIPDAPPVRKVDNRLLLADVMKMLAANQTADAIAALRDAVDAEPLDVERRRTLANVLNTAGLTALAAAEARRAAVLFPEQIDLRTLSARLWLSVGNMDEANADLNQAVVRDPNSVETRMLLGEVALAKLQVDAAIPHFDFVIAKSPSADAYFKRALARAMNDDAAGAATDLAEAKKLGLGSDPLSVKNQYLTAVTVSKGALSEIGVGIRTLIQRGRVNYAAKDVREDQKTLAKRADALLNLFGSLTVPPDFKNSHGSRILALKLLNQSLAELGSFLDSGSDDTLGDATITLGEALKALATAEATFKVDSAKG